MGDKISRRNRLKRAVVAATGSILPAAALETLSLNERAIPTITVVDHTFDRYRDVMVQIIARAKQRVGIA